MIEHAYDIAILGAGPVGSALALMLARATPSASRIALIRDEDERKPHLSLADPRVLALNHGSRTLLSSLQAWPEQTADIHCIHVSQRGRLGRTLIRNTDFDVAQLGSVVSYGTLLATLHERVRHSGVSLLAGPAARVTRQDATGITITQGEVRFTCGLAVQSHGTSTENLVRREYGQQAVLTRVQASLPRPGWAWERFTAEGPLALLPHPAIPGTYAVVWCCSPARAAQLATLNEADFSSALNAAFGSRLGRLTSVAGRTVMPLALSARRTLCEGRLVAIGNAAQSLHPVAGQGLNLGLRDAAQLAQTLAAWLLTPATPPAPVLERFARARRADRLFTAALTDFMPRIFTTGCAAIEHACGLALLTLDLAAPLRAPLTRHLLQGKRA